ncbi:MAG: DegT/DnrJ/EryC1/StrS family aminotransferase [Myxococcota bacterium]
MIPLFKVSTSPRAADLVAEVLESGYLGEGPKVEAFEAELAKHFGTPRVATVNSATSGIHLVLHMLREEARGPGDRNEVLSTPLTFPSSNWPVLLNGFRLKWVDVDPATLNVDLDDVARKITERTRAIVVVHWGGYPIDMARLDAILDEAEALHGHRPVVLEDCAHAMGSTYHGEIVGTHGNPSVFSFQAVKHLNTADGGMLILPDDEMWRRARRLRWLGFDRDGTERFRSELNIEEYGFKFHMNDVAAAMGLANLDIVDGNIRRHKHNAARYDQALGDVAGLQLTERREGFESSFWLYSILVDDRPGFMRRMNEAGIHVSQVQRRNDLHTCVTDVRSQLPGLDSVADRMVAIPVGWWLKDEDVDYVVETIRGGW